MKVVIWGAGGHGKVVADVVRAAGHEVVGYIDQDAARVGEVAEPGGATVLGNEEAFWNTWMQRVDAVALGVGHNQSRLEVYERLHGRVPMPPFVHPSAEISPGATIGEASVVMPRVVVNAAAMVGVAAILNSACVVEHDCQLGRGVHISPNATLSGAVHVGDVAWVGAGAAVIQGCRIGAESVVGAGSTVIRDIRPGTTNVGVPTREV